MRWRDLETGTYLTRDPAGFVDGPNLYAYVRQNPWSAFDPEGLWCIPPAAPVVAGGTVVAPVGVGIGAIALGALVFEALHRAAEAAEGNLRTYDPGRSVCTSSLNRPKEVPDFYTLQQKILSPQASAKISKDGQIYELTEKGWKNVNTGII